MKPVEISFPRGKPRPTNYISDESKSEPAIKIRKKISDHAQSHSRSLTVGGSDEDLFKAPRAQISSAPLKLKKRKKSGLTSEETEILLSGTKSEKLKTVVDPLTYEIITDGMLSLGRVVKVRDHEIVVSLPGRTMGSVPITGISKPYTKALEKLTLSDVGSDTEDPVYGVKDLFQVGQLVSVAVVGVRKDDHSIRITLSMAPNDIHASYSAEHVFETMVLTGAVESVEDHGYIVDVGIRGTHAFLPKDNAKAYIQNHNHGRLLGIGQLLKCKVVQCKPTGKRGSTKNFLTLTIAPKDVNRTRYTLETINNYQLLLPGFESEGTVMETHKTGIKVDFLDMVGQIHLDHMVDPWTLPGSLEIGATIFPKVLYILPNGTSPYLTLQGSICQKNPSVPVLSFTLGEKINVKIARIEKRGLIVKFESGERGFVSSTRCSDNSALTDEDIAKQFPVGSSHMCCVLEYSSLDNMYICSLQQSVLNQEIIRVDQLKAGQIVSCVIKAWKPSGAIVALGLAKGFIPKIHFGEIALKNPSIKYQVGRKINARVCRVDLTKNQVTLTAKKKLVKSMFPLLCAYEECKYGLTSEGVISKVTEFGLNIYTIGGLPGFIPASRVSTQTRMHITKLFFPGQVVQFSVVNANKEKNRLILSMLSNDSSLSKNGEDDAVKSVDKKEKYKDKKTSKTKKDDVKKKDVALSGKASKKRKSDTDGSSSAVKIKKSNQEEPRHNTISNTDKVSPPDKKKKKDAVALEVPCLDPPAQSFHDTSYLGQDIKLENELDNDEFTPNPDVLKHKKSIKQEKSTEDWNREEEIRKAEARLVDPSNVPATIDDFERLILASPNSSMAWSAYIAFVLNGANIEHARSVAARALKTILFREEEERENIWKVMLNMEADFGTEDSLKNAFTEATKANDALTMYRALCEIYERKKNSKSLESTLRIMTKKFPNEPSIWGQGLEHFYKIGEYDKGRELSKSAIDKLPKTEHIAVISKTAILELKYGDVERGRTLLDTTLRTYPKRLDLWIVYAAQLIKKGEYDMARDVFQSAVQVPFVPKRMLTVLKKFLQFEIDHGTPESRGKVKDIGIQYVNSVGGSSETFLDELGD